MSNPDEMYMDDQSAQQQIMDEEEELYYYCESLVDLDISDEDYRPLPGEEENDAANEVAFATESTQKTFRNGTVKDATNILDLGRGLVK
jgi:hypothetical protein